MKESYITEKELKELLKQKVTGVVEVKAISIGRPDLATKEALNSIVLVQALRYWASYVIKMKTRVKGSKRVAWQYFVVLLSNTINNSELHPYRPVRIRV